MFLYKKKTAIVIHILAVFLLILDRFLKNFAIYLDSSYDILGNFFSFSFVKNYYIAFSLPLGGNFLIFLILFIVLVLLVMAIRLYKQKECLQVSLLSFVFFGAISNLFDRLKYGYVVDYLDLQYFTVFNLADSMIFIGAVSIALLSLRREPSRTIDLSE